MAASTDEEPWSLPILETVKEAQMQNGLRHRDFHRYRQYCTRRLGRIRKAAKFHHGKGRAFVQKKVDAETATDAKHLYLLLHNAERAWSYAMQLKEDDNLEQAEHGDDANTRIKFHLHGRLRKAADWSRRLADVCANKADARTSLEAEAYASFMAGNLAFHREEHSVAQTHFATSRRIYTDLSQVGTSTQQELFRSLAEELDPFLRFCEHRLQLQTGDTQDLELGEGASNALLQSKIDQVLLEARKEKAASFATVEWKQQSVAIPTQDLAVALLRPEELQSKLDETSGEKKREQVLGQLLGSYDSLLQTIKSSKNKASGPSEVESLQLLEEVAHFRKLSAQRSRLVEVLQQHQSKPDKSLGDVVHVLDMLLQTQEDVLSMPELETKEAESYAQAQRHRSVFQAIKASVVAQSYVQDHQYSSALTLFQHASRLVQDLEPSDALLERLLPPLQHELAGAQSRTTAMAFLEANKVESKMQAMSLDDKSLLRRQSEFDGGSRERLRQIVDYPPSLESVPMKPMLLDTALYAFAFPSLDHRTMERQETEEPTGFFGWFRK